jgi:hypothetical protein
MTCSRIHTCHTIIDSYLCLRLLLPPRKVKHAAMLPFYLGCPKDLKACVDIIKWVLFIKVKMNWTR